MYKWLTGRSRSPFFAFLSEAKVIYFRSRHCHLPESSAYAKTNVNGDRRRLGRNKTDQESFVSVCVWVDTKEVTAVSFMKLWMVVRATRWWSPRTITCLLFFSYFVALNCRRERERQKTTRPNSFLSQQGEIENR